MRKNQALLLFMTLLTARAIAQPSVAVFKPTHISVFKNGTFFITKEAEVKPASGAFSFVPPSNALNGTFWLAAGKENKITSISIKPDTVKVTRAVQNIPQFISSSIGKNITLILPPYNSTGSQREIKGTVLAFFEASQIAKLKMADGKVMMCSIANVLEAYNDGSSADTWQQDSLTRMAKVKLQNNTGKINVSTVALQTGMNWVPSYYLKLNDDKTARLELKATIANSSAEAINNAAVDLVIGNPQLFYGSQLDEISTDYLQTQVLDYNRYAQNNYRLNNMYANNVMEADVISTGRKGAAYTPPPIDMANYDTEGEKTNDLYYFNLGNLDIEPYSKSIVPLLTTELGYKDLYELAIPDISSYWNNRYVNNNNPNQTFDTWHVLKIDNTGKAPFTKGPIFVIDQKDRPLAQDEMKYTAKGAEAKVQLSKAVDIQAKNKDEVVNASSGTKIIDGHTYTIALLKGKIEVNNYQPKSVKISIVKTVTGTVRTSSGADVDAVPQYNYYRNVLSTMKWEKEIAPGAKLELEYQYEVLLW